MPRVYVYMQILIILDATQKQEVFHITINLLIVSLFNRDKKKDEPAKTKAQRRAEKKNGENGDENGDSGDDKTEENGVEVKASPKEEEADDVQWSTDTSKEAVERRRRELLGDGTTQLASLVQNDLNISEKPVEEKPKTKGKIYYRGAIPLYSSVARVAQSWARDITSVDFFSSTVLLRQITHCIYDITAHYITCTNDDLT
jgi:hypothetical protein